MDPRSNILPFPRPDTAPPPVMAASGGTVAATRDVPMAEIARRLGIADMAWRSIIDAVRTLNARYSFPDPKNPRFLTHRGEKTLVRGARAIVRRSVFPRGRVEEWFDNHRAPDMRAADDADEARAAARSLAANARGMVAQLADRRASC